MPRRRTSSLHRHHRCHRGSVRQMTQSYAFEQDPNANLRISSQHNIIILGMCLVEASDIFKGIDIGLCKDDKIPFARGYAPAIPSSGRCDACNSPPLKDMRLCKNTEIEVRGGGDDTSRGTHGKHRRGELDQKKLPSDMNGCSCQTPDRRHLGR